MKPCRSCGKEKPFSDFYQDKTTKSGLAVVCKSCHSERRKRWYLKNKARRSTKIRMWKQANSEKVKRDGREYSRKWRKEHPEQSRAARKKWQKENAGRANAHNAMRYAGTLTATPKWANQFFIAEAYDLASIRSRMFGCAWNVDHIVPLKSKLVCGLHCEHNLRVIPAIENRKKLNVSWPDMWGD